MVIVHKGSIIWWGFSKWKVEETLHFLPYEAQKDHLGHRLQHQSSLMPAVPWPSLGWNSPSNKYTCVHILFNCELLHRGSIFCTSPPASCMLLPPSSDTRGRQCINSALLLNPKWALNENKLNMMNVLWRGQQQQKTRLSDTWGAGNTGGR